jgi:hypothetical protein
MFEVERNTPVDGAQLAEFFGRCGWQEEEAGAKLEWALAASSEWVVCRLDGLLVGFGRTCRLGPASRVLFDVVVDPRFQSVGLRREIVRLLTQNVSSLEEVSVFRERPVGLPDRTVPAGGGPVGVYAPPAPEGAYLGRRPKTEGG